MATRAQARLRMSGGALSLTVHAAAIALLLILGFAPIERQSPLPPLETSFIPLPEPIALEAVQPKSDGDGAAGPGPPRRDPSRAVEDSAHLPAEALASPVSAADRPAQAGAGAGDGHAGSATGDGAGGPGSGGASHGIGPGDTMTFARPEWIQILSQAQMRPYFPRKAIYDRVDGRAALACQVDRHNRARNCRVLSESPPGFGFGIAALRMSRLFRIRPPRVNGLPERDAWVRIPIDFDVT
jgi:periplasmic protein TonB